jgi:GT2 family glycosyltransferase
VPIVEPRDRKVESRLQEKSTIGAPTLAVGITYHNEAELLTECLNSLLNQPGAPDEVWIYDDASSKPAADYLPPHAQVHIVRGEQNRGPAFGRNQLARLVNSDYLHFHDSDDLFTPVWCARVRERMAHGADVIFSEIDSFTPEGRVYRSVIEWPAAASGDALLRHCIRGAVLPAASTYRTSLIQALGGFRTDLRQSEDYEFNVRAANACLLAGTVVLIPEAITLLRRRTDSHSRLSASETRVGRREKPEVSRSGLIALEELWPQLPDRFHADVAYKATGLGRVLCREGLWAEARRAFRLAKAAGGLTYESGHGTRKALARIIGPIATEWLANQLRRLR